MALTFNNVREKILDFIKNTDFTAVTKSSFEASRVDGKAGKTLAVFLVEKPEIYGDTATNYILIKWHQLNGGEPVKQFNVEISIHSKDIYQCIELKDGLVNLLDYYNRPCDLDGIVKFRLNNEGGIYTDAVEERYVDKLYFDCKLI